MSKNLVSKLEGMLSTGELLKIVDECNASSQVLYRLGFSNKGQYVKIVKEFLLSNDVCIKHFKPNGTKAAE